MALGHPSAQKAGSRENPEGNRTIIWEFRPTGIVSIAAFSAAPITDTLPEMVFATELINASATLRCMPKTE
jgi:hypothetical protein